MSKNLRLEDSELARLSFHGAAGTVTGSGYLLETRSSRVLFECGMFQGGRSAETKNRQRFRFKPKGVDAAVLSHAHIDHSGLLPKLVKDGFHGPIHATKGTADLLEIMLRDSARIQEGDAERESKYNLRKGKEAVEPNYTVKDAEAALDRLQKHHFGERVVVTDDVSVRFRQASHIFGAASVEIFLAGADGERKIAFSGDLGRNDDPLLPDVDPPDHADLVIMESTYGDRDHRDKDATIDELVEILRTTDAQNGSVIIPVFAVGRAQEIIYVIGELERQGRIEPRRVFLDSPMAINVTRLYRENRDCCRDDARTMFVDAENPITTRDLAFTPEVAQSIAINDQNDVVILSASGMCDGGRIGHHLKHRLWRRDTHLLFVGYQARGSTGRAIVDGAKSVRIHGETIAVGAQIHTLGGFSAHADQSELIAWYQAIGKPHPPLVLVHGEDDKRAILADKIAQSFGVSALQPQRGDVISIPHAGSDFQFVGERAAKQGA